MPGGDTHGDSDFKSIGNTYGDPYGSGLSYTYSNSPGYRNAHSQPIVHTGTDNNTVQLE